MAVVNGRLAISPASGKPVPADWLANHSAQLMADIANKSQTLCLTYLGYATGNYGKHRAGGVTLQFCDMATGQPHYAIFNVETHRKRSTRHGKAGHALPAGQFRAGKRSAFVSFWNSTGLPARRLSDFHDYMGKLSAFVFTAEITDGEKLTAATLRPLTLHLSDKCPTSPRQLPDKAPTTAPDKETQQSQQHQGFQAFSTTGPNSYGNTVIRECGNTGSHASPANQTDEEWFAEYDAAS